jgi:hypothetical protein
VFPGESEFVQKFLSVWSHSVVVMILSLVTNPPPKRLVLFVLGWHHAMSIDSFKLDQLCLFVPGWHHAMAIDSFKLDQLFKLLAPELFWLVVGAPITFPSEPDFVQ